jgi:hypothetical protein
VKQTVVANLVSEQRPHLPFVQSRCNLSLQHDVHFVAKIEERCIRALAARLVERDRCRHAQPARDVIRRRVEGAVGRAIQPHRRLQ